MQTARLPAGTNVDDLRTAAHAGLWTVASGAMGAEITGWPSSHGGTMQVLVAGQITTQVVFPYAFGRARPQVLVRTLTHVTRGTWTEWVDIAAAGAPTAPVPASGHTVRARTARARRGGTIGTAGRAVVALRFDHGTLAFRDHVLPVLRQYGLPASVCFSSRRWNLAEHGGLTAADVQPWLLEDGIELWNHSATHMDSSGPADIYDNIVTGLAELELQFPKVAIDGWMPPGLRTANPLGPFDGYDNGATDEQYDTYAGQLILAHHGLATGYRPGQLLPLTGEPQIGGRHFGYDARTLADVQARVGDAVRTGTGLVLMLHPSLVDRPGFVGAAQVARVLGWVAAQRDAGAVEVLTVGGLMFADRSRSDRHDLLVPMEAPARLQAGASTARQHPSTDWPRAAGGVRRIEVDVEAARTGTLTVTVEGSGSRTLPLPAGRRTLARHVTIPLDATRCHVTVTPSVAATVHQVAALAA